MEGELWEILYPMVRELGERYRQSGVQFSNRAIVLVYVWAVLHDRPVCWACDPANWPAELRPAVLPSGSTMSRRMQSISVLTFLEGLASALRDRFPRHWVKTIDAKPLPVGPYSKDPDTHWGYAGPAQAKGYKIFGICDGEQAIDAWRLGPMNESEVQNGIRLLERAEGAGYLLGDALYDANPLYAAAAKQGWQLLTPRQKPNTGLGHRPQHPSRLRAIELLPTPFGQALYACRTSIERFLGNMCSFGCGLGPLPAWVRRPHRVATWIQVKIIINYARLIRKQQLAA
jgi:hypothetical protein